MKKDQDRYYKFSRYLKERFGCRVYKVSIDAGFSCPNKDGRLSKQGCIYCDNSAFSFNTRICPGPIEHQIREGINFGRKRYGAEKFIVYFQAYTNTYAPLDVLKQTYDTATRFGNVAGIAIGTRPDCVDEQVLDLIDSYTSDYEVWIEYGLQSIHRKTLQFINRGHLYEDFLKAVELTRKRPKIKICAHVIIGLPEETGRDILETAGEMSRLKLEGIKIHPLHVIKGTKLEGFFNKSLYKPMQLDDYVRLVADFLEHLWPDTVIQRITADCPSQLLAAPRWILNKSQVIREIESALSIEDKFQGRLYKE